MGMWKEWLSTIYGQKSVDGRSQWRTDMRETEVGLDAWCEGGLEQQRNDGEGCATIFFN